MLILITGAWDCTPELLNAIRCKGHEVLFMQNESDKLPEGAEFADGIICNGLFLYHDIQKFSKLKYIQLTSAGFDRVPMDYIKEHNIEIHNARGVYSIPMAEYAVCGVLQLYKQSRFFDENQNNNLWKKHRGLLELDGKTVCIVGCGNVGTECAKRFKGFGCQIIGVDIFPYNNENYTEIKSLKSLNDVLPIADILILTVPLTDDTKHLIDDKRIKLLKNDAVLVNISRGAVVETNALVENIDNLYGAVLDVFENEPLESQNPLWNKKNVIITPHNSFVSEGNKERLSVLIINNLRS